MAKNKLKLYTHHFTYVEETLEEVKDKRPPRAGRIFALPLKGLLGVCYGFGMFLVRFCSLVAGVLAKLSYLAGLTLLYPFTLFEGRGGKAQVAIEHKIVSTTETLKDRLGKFRTPQFAYTLVVFLVLCATVLGSFNMATLYTRGQSLKGMVLGQTSNAVRSLERGKSLLSEQETEAATKAFDKALYEFASSRQSVSDAGAALNLILNVVPAKGDAEELLVAGQFLASSAKKLTHIYESVKQITVANMGLRSPNGLETDLVNIRDSLVDATADIEAASVHLHNADSDRIPEDMRQKFLDSRELVDKAAKGLRVLGDVVDIGMALFVGDKNVVLFFENNNELRSSGGFPGSFADFSLSGGAIENLRVGSIYDLDGQLQERILPPLPLFMVNERWFLRDSNWFVNFPESAEIMGELYAKTAGRRPDIVIVLTPNLIVDILKVTGPLYVPGYDVTLDSDNFVEQTQIETSIEYDKLENKPKKMLSDLLPQLWQRVSELSRDNLFLVLAAVQKNLVQGNILFYAKDADLQKRFSNFNWTGEVRRTDRDFLYISRSNLGGTKTDTYIEQSVSLESAIGEDSTIVNTLRITRTNPLPPTEGMTNTSFIRILVPQGSELISNSGFSPEPFVLDFKPEGRLHPSVVEWERQSVKDVVTGTVIGVEAGKTFFANWMVLKGGESKTVEIKYKLPFTLEALDHMSLLTQKQPGATDFDFRYMLRFPGRTVHWKNFTPTGVGSDQLEISKSFDATSFYGLVVEQEQ